MGKACYSLISKVENLSKEKEALNSLNSELKKLSKAKSECKIYRVHQHLRNVNPGAYEPEIISIGPYHRSKGHLKMMENHKLRNLQSLVKRQGFKYAAAVSSVESSKARTYYADQNFSLTDSQFIKMLVLDGCFIVELVRKYADGCLGEEGDDPIFGMEWMIISLQRDLMLFENQIPFFVLRNLFHHIKGPNETRTLPQLLTIFFSNLYLGKGYSEEVLLQGRDHKIKHLLDLIHRNWVLPRLQQLNSSLKKKDKKCQKPNHHFRTMCLQERKENEVVMGSEMKEKEIVTIDRMPVLERNETDFTLDMLFDETDVEMGSEIFINHATELQQLNSKKKDEECQKPNRFRWMCGKTDVESGNEEKSFFISHATELTEANVEFKMEEKETLFDICFRDGAMVMAPLRIEDGTECFLRNLIVYEQYFQQELSHTVVTDYMMLLHNLIDSAKDVELLSKKGIIINWLGDAEVVANMVNKLGDLVICVVSNFSYATVFGQVNKHCRKLNKHWKKRWNRWMATLRRDYLNSPWRIISIIAAVVLLLLTVTQTIFSILQVVQEN